MTLDERPAVPSGKWRTGRQGKHGAFTLIELLVVISVISLLLSTLVPALCQARILGHRVACQARLKAIGHAAVLYQDVYDEYVPMQIDNGSTPGIVNRWMSWRALLLPYVSSYEAFNCPAATGSGEVIRSREELLARELDNSPRIAANMGSYGVIRQKSLPTFQTLSVFGSLKQGDPYHSLVFSTRAGVAWTDPTNSVYVADGAWCEGPITYPTRAHSHLGTSHINSPSESPLGPYPSEDVVVRRFADRHLGTNCLFLGGHVLNYETRELDDMEAGDSSCVWDVY